jgi:hypothetical protein
MENINRGTPIGTSSVDERELQTSSLIGVPKFVFSLKFIETRD